MNLNLISSFTSTQSVQFKKLKMVVSFFMHIGFTGIIGSLQNCKMKTSYLLLIIFTLVNSSTGFAQGNWTWKNPSPQGNHLKALHVFDVSNVIFLGNHGTVVQTSDAGSSFTINNLAEFQDLNDVTFITPSIGFAVGSGGYGAITTDGGLNWTLITLPVTTQLYGVDFIDENTGWICGSSGVVLKTTDGGQNWVQQSTGVSQNLNKIEMIDSSVGWIVGSGGQVLTTSNGGETWSTVSLGIDNNLNNVFFLNSSTGFIVGDSGKAFKTVNGSTWSEMAIPNNATSFSVFFLNENLGWITTTSGIIRTENGGLNWDTFSSNLYGTQWIRDVKFSDDLNGWACADGGGMSKTTDGGLTWSAMSSGVSETLFAVDFATEEIGFAVGSGGVFFKTTNGQDWEEMTRSNVFAYSMDFIDENTGWLAGQFGKISKTTDGGQNWIEQTTNTSNTLRSVCFVDSQNGFAVGESGTFLKTTNGGDTWSLSVISTFTLYAVHFVDTNTGWASGSAGTIIKTIDGGVTWTPQSVATTSTLYDLQFIDENVGYIASQSRIYKTINGGTDWVSQDLPISATIWNLDFVNEYTGWASGSNGRVFYTEDGGDSWTVQETYTDHFIYGLKAVAGNKAYLATNYGSIMNYYREPEIVYDTVSLSLSGDKTELATSDTLTIQIIIGETDPAEDVIGASLELAWDSDAFEYIDDSAEIGDFFTSNPLFFATKKSGERVIDLSAGSGLSEGTNGSGTIATLKFKAISDANVSFSIQNSRVEKKSGESLDVEVSGLDVSISTLIIPVISSFDIQTTEVGGIFKINGENFGESLVEGSSVARVGDSFETGVNLIIDEWTDTQITVYIPNDVEPGSYTVFVRVGNQIAASTSSFTIESAKILTNFENLIEFVTSVGAASAAQAFIISGNRLTNDVTISVNDTDFEISKTQNGTFSNQLVYSKSGNVLVESQVWIRISATASEGLAEAVFVLMSENAVSRPYYIAGTVNPAGSPVISSISPRIGSIGTEVTITGANFGSAQDGSTLKMGLNSTSTLTLSPSSWSDTEVKVTIPELSIIGDYAFYITVNSVEAISPVKFTYVSSSTPFISSISPTSLRTDETLTISGNNFGTIQASSKIWIGSNINNRSEITPQSWSETVVSAIIPSFFGTGFYSVWLEINGTLIESSEQIQIVKTASIDDNTITLNGVNGKSGNPVTGNRPFIEFEAVAGAQDYRITMESNSGSNFTLTTETSFRYPTELNYGETYTVTITPRFLLDSGSEPIDGPSVSIVFNVFSYSSTVSNSVSYSPSGDLLASDFRLLGISGASTSISSLISIPSEEYKVFRWSGSSFSEFYSNSVPGEGYWVIAASPFQVSTAPASVTLDENNAYSIPIKSDWNIIANPFGTSINWTEELGGGQALYEWAGNWVPTTTLQPSKAYAWKNTTGNSELVLNYYDLIVNQESAKRSSSSDNQASKKQVITLLAQGDESFGTRSVQVAIYPESQNQNLDKFDTELPPQPFEVSQISLIDESNKSSRFIRKALTSSKTGYSVPLAFELLEDQNLQLHVDFSDELNEAGLINLINGRYYSLTKDLIQINLPKGNHKFQFVSGESSFIHEQQATLMPKDFTLTQNYPNPFNPSTQIAFSLPIASTVKLEVYDLLGRRVALLADGMLNAGYHTRLFDGSDLSSGMYLYRIQAGDFIQVKKMMLLK